MLRLMTLELKRNNVRTYLIASLITCVVMLGFIYLFAYAPHIDPDPDLQVFAGYDNLISMYSILSMAVFATLAAVMGTRFVTDEYKEKRAMLLFSYPVKRDKVLLAKLLVVFLFTMGAMILCNFLAFGIFSISESISPLVTGTLSVQIIIRVIKITIIMAIVAATLGVIAVGIGFIKKSVPTTIVSAVLIASLFCNIMFNSTSDVNKSDTASIIFMGLAIIAGTIATTILMHKVKHMEVE